MPRYNPDLSKVQIGFVTLKKDDVEFSLGPEVKHFNRTKTENGEEVPVFGLTYVLTVQKVETEENQPTVGRTMQHNLFFHSPASEGMNYQFAMACLGFPIDEVDKFKEKYGDADFGVDFETGEIGKFWQELCGTRVAASTDLKPRKDDPSKMNQQFNWRPI